VREDDASAKTDRSRDRDDENDLHFHGRCPPLLDASIIAKKFAAVNPQFTGVSL